MKAIRTHQRRRGARAALLAALFAVALCAIQALQPGAAARQSEAPEPLIAYDQDGQLFVMKPDGTGKRLVGPGADPSWSPDGTQLVFTLGNHLDDFYYVYKANLDGSNYTRLTTASTHNGSADWSKATGKIAYVSRRRDITGLSRWRIYVMNADGSNDRPLIDPIYDDLLTGEYAPAWSPDGRHVAFIGERVVNGLHTANIYVVPADRSTGPRRLTGHDGFEVHLPPAWSPDGTRLTFSYMGDIYTINAFDGSDERNLTNYSEVYEEGPAWSPDGSRLALTSTTPDDWFPSIHVTDADAGNRVNTYTTFGYNPVWRPGPGTPGPTPTPTPNPTPDTTPTPDATPTPEPTPACATNVDHQVEVRYTGLRYNFETRRYAERVVVKNVGTTSLKGGLAIVVPNLPDGLSLANATGTTTCKEPLGAPYVERRLFSYFECVGDPTACRPPVWDELLPGHSISTYLEFENPGHSYLNYQVNVLTMPGRP
jgi:hypothetical protein